MTVTPVTPPVFIHPLADRHGVPSALLLDARGMQPETAPLALLSVAEATGAGALAGSYGFRNHGSTFSRRPA